MLKLSGNSINNGVFIGRALHLIIPEHKVENYSITAAEVEGEIKKFEVAIAFVDAEIGAELMHSTLSSRDLEIIASHRDILHDPEIHNLVISAIRDRLQHAGMAVQTSFKNIVEQFESMSVETFALRAADYRDIGTRLLNSISGIDSVLPESLDSDQIPILSEMTPSLVSKLAVAGIKAYLCAKGSYNSHSSILSRALGLVAIANLPALMEQVNNDDLLVLDGDEGKLVIDPDEETLEFYAQKIQVEELLRQKLEKLKASASQNAEGERIELYANLGLPEELDAIANLGCDGIGLFRTEFLYIARQNLPSEDEQFEIYRQIAERMAPTPVTIRTFDLGGDKLAPFGLGEPEENPYLGNRGIRFSLLHHEIFHTQLRAILRASAFGKLKILFPMIIDAEDFSEAKHVFNHCQEELYSQGIAFDSSIPLGAMVEIPSAALGAESLAQEADFLSIGTNDLVQYTLAVDRNNENVSRYYIQHHPTVLKLIRITAQAAKRQGIPLSVCGEMASSPQYVPLLIGMGIRDLSINPAAFFTVKAIIRNCDANLEKLVADFDFNTSVREVEQLLYIALKPYYQI
jgi:phosphotransferase system enzyme I (PtsI)